MTETAVHEAGHSVVAVQYGFPLRRVVVHQRRRADGEAGLTELVSFTDAINADAFRALVYTLAGPAAERQFTGRSDCGDLRDRQHAAVVTSVMHAHKPVDHPDVAGTLARAALIARALMYDPVTWKAVTAVAKALTQHRRLSGREVLQLVRQQVRA